MSEPGGEPVAHENVLMEKMNNISLKENSTTENAVTEVHQTSLESDVNNSIQEESEERYWGFSLHETYKMAIKFYKENEGKRTFAMSYEDKVYFAALTKQVTLGPFAQQTQLPEVGYLDMFGNDRRRIWESFEDMSSNDARRNFIKHLTSLASVFEPFMTAHQKQREEEDRIRLEEERKKLEEEERIRKQKEEEQKREEEKKEQERMRQENENIQIEQKRQIMSALNDQTAVQFKQYAAQQFPGNPDQQAALISQLQEQHYNQYMQLYLQQQQQAAAAPGNSSQQVPPGGEQAHQNAQQQVNGDEDNENSSDDEDDTSGDSVPRIAEPSLWTRPQIDEFKEQIKRDPESVITVGRGEVVTVRVPTHEEGAYVFWEYATDYYDLGFGVYFEWSDATAQQVSVHVNESSEDEITDEDREGSSNDPERGSKTSSRPLTDEVVPVFRRECHTEVHAGSHRYPGRGVYLLKFDNSYSLWRSKTLYYRVYYTR